MRRDKLKEDEEKEEKKYLCRGQWGDEKKNNNIYVEGSGEMKRQGWRKVGKGVNIKIK